MQVHFIAIGGSVMHNLAIALHKKGYTITGSDDSIFDPSYSKLQKYGLLPQTEGWNADKIHPKLDAVILGMHAKTDNPELQKAKELGLKIYSFPEYLYEQTKDKKRVVIGGSHGKTTITSMVMHVLRENNIPFDYMVGSQISGFETMVHLDKNNEIAVFEGDEYLSSTIDKRPKFHLYKPHIALISGIAWDHINVFPTFENYKKQFSAFIDQIKTNGSLVYYQEDETLNNIVQNRREDLKKIAYKTPTYTYKNEQSLLHTGEDDIPLQVFGRHNLTNIEGARLICNRLGIEDKAFYRSIQSFEGASKRLQLIRENEHSKVFLDFAHAPSKVKATVEAVKEQYPEKTLITALELHTFSSLNSDFLSQYEGTMKKADYAFVYYNPKAIEHKGVEMIKPKDVKHAFGNSNMNVFTDIGELLKGIQALKIQEKIVLIMSSGNLGGLNIEQVSDRFIR